MSKSTVAQLLLSISFILAALFSSRMAAQNNYTCPQNASSCFKVGLNGWIVGEVRAFAFGGQGGKTPSRIVAELHKNGWLECEGQTLLIGEFTDLHNAIGETWGSKDPGKTFLVPDLRGIFLRGWNHFGSQVDQPGGIRRDPQFPDMEAANRLPPRTIPDVGQNGNQGNRGDAVGSMQASAMQSHKHVSTMGYADVGAGGRFGAYTVIQHPGDHLDTSEAQPVYGHPLGNSAYETRPSNAYVMYFIYVGKDVSNVDPFTGSSVSASK